jgi:pyruvate dehydrogenase E2 component (dihydrolipoamide acetyltransferase)
MAEFRMPSLGADMERGTLVHWFVKPGDLVKRGDIFAEVETQKGVIDVEIFEGGEISELVVPEGEEAPVGAVLALLNGARAVPTVVTEETAPEEPVVEERPVEAAPVQPPARPSRRREALRVSTVARRLAEELGIDLTSVQGSGPGGAIGLGDVRRAARDAGQQPVPARQAPADQASAMRAAIAAAMTRSKREIPHYYLGTDIDIKAALDWLEAENRRRPVTERLLSAALLVKAVALAVRDVPEMNGSWVDDAFQPGQSVHVGVAISLRDGGLIAPAVLDADRKSLGEVMEAMSDLVMRARGGKLRSSELTDATITVTSLGEQGVDTVYGVISPPQVALVGFGEIVERPVAVDGMIGVRPVIRATLSADHRASVGHRGGVFLRRVRNLLQTPEDL